MLQKFWREKDVSEVDICKDPKDMQEKEDLNELERKVKVAPQVRESQDISKTTLSHDTTISLNAKTVAELFQVQNIKIIIFKEWKNPCFGFVEKLSSDSLPLSLPASVSVSKSALNTLEVIAQVDKVLKVF